MSTYNVVGVMSGTSMDGLDLAHCRFEMKDSQWHYSISAAETYSFPEELKKRLKDLDKISGMDLLILNSDFGKFTGDSVLGFLDRNSLKADFISSHGHTVFHKPDKGITCQIGDGNAIYSSAKIPVINDFRSLDIALGGQGAPLVPVGDRLLFGEFDFCLNLGGIANISFEKEHKRVAFDISPFNILFNYLSNKLSKEFDEAGSMASQGSVIKELLNELNNISYYRDDYPKSLDKLWIENFFVPIIDSYQDSITNKLRTVSEHLSQQISKVILKEKNTRNSKMLITGGGALNTFFISLLTKRLENSTEVVLPEKILINYKEALIFAFLGVLKINGFTNVYSSVTGASRDSCSGVIYSDKTFPY